MINVLPESRVDDPERRAGFERKAEEPSSHLDVVLNWFSEVTQKVQDAKAP